MKHLLLIRCLASLLVLVIGGTAVMAGLRDHYALAVGVGVFLICVGLVTMPDDYATKKGDQP